MVYTKELTHTAEDAAQYLELAAKLRLTDFNPLVVDWKNPVPWYEDGKCEMSDSGGCLMPLGAGLCATPPSERTRSNGRTDHAPCCAQRHRSRLRCLLLDLHDNPGQGELADAARARG